MAGHFGRVYGSSSAMEQAMSRMVAHTKEPRVSRCDTGAGNMNPPRVSDTSSSASREPSEAMQKRMFVFRQLFFDDVVPFVRDKISLSGRW